jgi:hypothetical protein
MAAPLKLIPELSSWSIEVHVDLAELFLPATIMVQTCKLMLIYPNIQ